MSVDSPPTISKGRLWAGRILGGLPALALILGGVMNVTRNPEAVKGALQMGYSENVLLPLGIAVLVSAVLYLVPRTAVLGAILLTGYLGGAVDVHVRQGDGPVEILIPVLFGGLLWLGLVLRDARLAALLPVRRPPHTM